MVLCGHVTGVVPASVVCLAARLPARLPSWTSSTLQRAGPSLKEHRSRCQRHKGEQQQWQQLQPQGVIHDIWLKKIIQNRERQMTRFARVGVARYSYVMALLLSHPSTVLLDKTCQSPPPQLPQRSLHV